MAAIRLEFAQFGHFDSFDVIRSITSMVGIADVDLPTPITTGLKTMYYVDANVIEDITYYYKVRVWRGTTSFVSSEIKAYAILGSNFVFKSPFYASLVDEVGKVWTPNGTAAIQNSALKLINQGSTGVDYLTTPISNASQIFSVNDFTLRFKVKLNRITDIHIFCSCRNYSEGAGFWLGLINNGLCFATHNNSTNNAVYFQVPVTLNTTDFFNISIERKDQKYYLYFNNNLVESTTTATGIKAPSTTPKGMAIGIQADDDRYFLSGYMRDFEIINYALGDGNSQSPVF